jgi:hypothetical protein
MRAGLACCTLAAAAMAACGNGSPAGPTGTMALTLELRYVSPPPPATLSVDAGMCLHHNAPGGFVVAHPAWTADVRLKEVEGAPQTWAGTLDAASGRELRVAVRDISLCAFDGLPDGLWTRSGLSVNGVTLTRIEPLSSAEPTIPAFVFTVTADGRVQ